MVETANKKIKGSYNDWDLALEDVQFAVNNTDSEVTNETPHFLLYGLQKREGGNVLV